MNQEAASNVLLGTSYSDTVMGPNGDYFAFGITGIPSPLCSSTSVPNSRCHRAEIPPYLKVELTPDDNCPVPPQGALSYNQYPTLQDNDFGPSNWTAGPNGTQTLTIPGSQVQLVST